MLRISKKYALLVAIMLVIFSGLMLIGCSGTGSSGSDDKSGGSSDSAGTTPEKTNFIFLSGPTGTTWYSQASALPGILSKEYDWKVDVRPGSAISNVIMLEQGKADIGLTFSSFLGAMAEGKVVAVQGENEYFKEPVQNAVQMMNATTAAYVLLVDAKSPYYKITDLKDKPITYVTYPAGFTAKYVPENMLALHGVPIESIEKAGGKVITVSKYQEACDLLAKGQADCVAYTMAVNTQSAALSELESQREFRMLELDPQVIPDITKEIPVVECTIAKGLQKSIKEDTVQLADVTIWMVNKDLPDEAVEKICDAVLKNMDVMAEVGNSEFKGFTAKEMSRLAGEGPQPKYHPGAVKFYAKHGITVE